MAAVDAAGHRPRPESYKVHATDEQLKDLLGRLNHVKWPDQDVPNEEWAYGSELGYIRDLVKYWLDEFDWNEMEEYINGGFGCGAEHFTLKLPEETGNPGAGLRIHYVHAVTSGGDGTPLLLLHGWPGSFFEFHKILPLLVEAGFDVVAPSLPGYGFSERPKIRNFDTAAMARTVDLLMRSLGYSAYVAQGGDWGAMICRNIAQLTSMGRLSTCKAIHVNMIIVPPPPAEATAVVPEEEKKTLARKQAFQAMETGYQKIQGTKPQTLGFALADSPVGLLAWIVEKFRAWSDCGGNPENAFSKDEMLTGVMLYWISESITSSTRLYYETIGTGAPKGEGSSIFLEKVTIPAGFARFPGEPFNPPKSWAAHSYSHILRDEELPRGGHFAAWEVPELLAEEIKQCFLGGSFDARAACGKRPLETPSRL